jgi:alpha-1,2-mannosyltransferase
MRALRLPLSPRSQVYGPTSIYSFKAYYLDYPDRLSAVRHESPRRVLVGGARADRPQYSSVPVCTYICHFCVAADIILRPEKDHPTQLRSFALLLKQHPDLVQPNLRLGLVGGARNDPDYARVESLRALAASLDIADRVEFHVNASYPDMLDLLRRATAGIHTMADEHFGISVVELMAAGVLPVAHASAGPLMDIVVPTPDGRPTGFLASDDASFMEGMRAILAMPEEARRKMRERARQHAVEAFNEDVFTKSWDESGWQKWIVA